jgi:hypothetical protein
MPPSRQERRKAEREAAKRAPARAGAAGAAGANQGAAGAAAALANLRVNVNPPLGDWTTQAKDPTALLHALGPQMVKQKAAAGDRDAQYSLGYVLVGKAGGEGSRWLRAADRRSRMRAWRSWRRRRGKGTRTLCMRWEGFTA